MLCIRGNTLVSKLKVPHPLSAPCKRNTAQADVRGFSCFCPDRNQTLQAVLAAKSHPHFPNRLRHKTLPLSRREVES